MALSRRKLIRAIALFLTEDDYWKEEVRVDKPKRTHRFWVRDWVGDANETNTIYGLQKQLERTDPAEFKSLLRIDVDTFYWLVELLRPKIEGKDTYFRKARKAEVKLSLTLNYLAAGGTNGTLSRQYRVGRTAAGKIIKKTCAAIHDVLCDEYLTTPTAVEEWTDIAREFEARWQFPHCVGAIDGKHVRVKCPNNSGSLFYNYRGFFSIVLLAVVSANYEFLFVQVGAEGRMSDGGSWRECEFRRAMDDGRIRLPEPAPLPGCENGNKVPYVLVGDDAFPLGPGLLKPYARRDMDIPQRVFNYRLSRARRISENAFGILANRFRIFLTTVERHPDTIVEMVLAACALHNLLRRRCPRSYMPTGSVDGEDSNFETVAGSWRTGDVNLLKLGPTSYKNPTKYAKAVQEIYKDYFMGAGAVPWQMRMINKPAADTE